MSISSSSSVSPRFVSLIRRHIDPWNDDRTIPIIINGTDVSQSTKSAVILQEENVEKEPEQYTTHVDKPTTTTPTTLFSNPQLAIVLLNFVAILWGTQHAVIKSVVTDESATAAAFTLCRFALAALVAMPAGLSEWWWWWSSSSQKNNDAAKNDELQQAVNVTTLVRWGSEMGLWMFLGFAFQAVGLETTTAQKSGFLLYLNVKFVPFFAWLGYGRRISVSTWVSALTAVVGTFLMGGLVTLGMDETVLTDAQRWNVGDVWSIAAAAASAMFILRLESASRALPRHAASLNALSLIVVTSLAVLWTTWTSNPQEAAAALDVEALYHVFSQHVWEFLYLGGVTTAVANWIQTSAQRYVSAERASLIYAMDPVYGAAFSYLWLGEAIPGTVGWIGAVLIASAAASNAWLEWDKTKIVEPQAHSD